MSLAGVAKETLAIVERAEYVAPSGKQISLRVQPAVEGTRLYRPDDFAGLEIPAARFPTVVEVTDESTAQAGRRLAPGVVLLNFASAKNPGGGFLGGAKAQEEDLARCSALYTCQITQRPYYDANRATSSMLYTDHLIYSPEVPFFRDDRLDLLEEPFYASVITSPAPNAGEERQRTDGAKIHETLERRAAQVLQVAARHRQVVLGAWGCGVFRNDPAEVAAIFHALLEGKFRGVFERVTFAIYDRSKEKGTLRAFQKEFTPPVRPL